MKKVKKYIIDNGEMFDGTVEQFQDCFFSNADEDTVRDWCNNMDYNLEVIYE